MLALAQEHEYRLDGCEALEYLAEVACAAGRVELGMALIGAVEADRASRGEVFRWPHRAAVVRALIDAHGPLPEPTLTYDEAVALARRSRGERVRPSHGWASLTPVELDVARAIAEGATNAEVAKSLLMSANTVKTHLAHIFSKLGINNRAELASETTRRSASD